MQYAKVKLIISPFLFKPDLPTAFTNLVSGVIRHSVQENWKLEVIINSSFSLH